MSSTNTDGMSSGIPAGIIATFVVVAVLSVFGTIVVAVLVYRYFSKHGLPSINFYAPTTAAPPTTIPIPNGETTVENFLNELAGEKPIRFWPQQLAGFTRNYATKLGSGGFGSVYKGELPNGLPVAVKVLSGSLGKRVEEQFMAEVGTIGRTHHINLVRLFGFCFDPKVRALVYEYMENGSLDRYLFDRINRTTDWKTLHEIAIGTARGIRYLHEECQQRIIHYDIKPGNILLDSNFNPKVADFGLAKLMKRENTHLSMPGGRGTPGYAAPEMWMPSPVTHKCDVYSFGMLHFEIVGRRRNFDGDVTESQQWFPKIVYDKFESGALAEIVSSCGIEEEIDREKAERVLKAALWCVQYTAEARPPMSKVVMMLEGEMEITPPTNPFQRLYASGAGLDLWGEGGSDFTSTSVSETTPIMRKYDIERETA
ncbi:G-type lectin S-receptor-like serine/threonine-protein kinase SD2-5 [Musa acuminata AAA Group]|uniref:G-type lectin S-receptor-like serine/threonine-protein kinase SD2-5 n=1 Tax=Musa acuminata AAA Group TaxID=214697 RepID=UPI0031E19526